MKLEQEFDSNFRYVLVAARRARQLQNRLSAAGGYAFFKGLKDRAARDRRGDGAACS